jgi:anti-anti-sigma factor
MKFIQLRKELQYTIEKGTPIILDLKNVTFMDSAGLAALVLIQKRVNGAGGKLFLSSIREPVKMLFELTSMDRVFEIITDNDD